MEEVFRRTALGCLFGRLAALLGASANATASYSVLDGDDDDDDDDDGGGGGGGDLICQD